MLSVRPPSNGFVGNGCTFVTSLLTQECMGTRFETAYSLKSPKECSQETSATLLGTVYIPLVSGSSKLNFKFLAECPNLGVYEYMCKNKIITQD